MKGDVAKTDLELGRYFKTKQGKQWNVMRMVMNMLYEELCKYEDVGIL